MEEYPMTDTTTRGGFAGNPADARTAAGSGDCCGNPAPAAVTTVDVRAAAPCCGTAAEAVAADACCAPAAKADAVATGAGCCG
jgi:hypothetical protein